MSTVGVVGIRTTTTNHLENTMKTTPRTICSTIAAALAISMLAGACGDSSTDQTVAESSTAVDDTTTSASSAEETASASDSDNADQTGDSGSQATSETEEQTSGSNDDASQSGSAGDDMAEEDYEADEEMAEEDYEADEEMAEEDYEADEEMAEEDYEAEEEMAEEDYEAASQPEVEGEDCDEIRDRNQFRLDIEGPATVINNDLAKPGDACDVYVFLVDGMSNFGISNGIVQFSITCDAPDDVEVATGGSRGWRYEHGYNNGPRYDCGESWTESVAYQSNQAGFTVYIRPLRETGTSSYQIVALALPT